MNIKFKFINNKVLVTKDNHYVIERDVTNNIEEILITENNIEEIENMISKNQSNINDSKNKIKFNSLYYYSLAGLNFVNCALRLTDSELLTGIAWGTVGISWGSYAYFNYVKPEKELIQVYNKKIEYLQESLNKENEKLNELKNQKNNDLMYLNDEEIKLKTSKLIEDLKSKLCVIQKFNYNKRKYINYYKKGILIEILKGSFYKDNEITFMEELIKNEISTNEHKKQKIKTR